MWRPQEVGCRADTVTHSPRHLCAADHNQLDDATASAFSKVLASNRSLARLSMQGNDISPLGAQDLVNGFVQSASLKQLSLQSNDFGIHLLFLALCVSVVGRVYVTLTHHL